MSTVTSRNIPVPVITVVAEALKDSYSASKLRGLFAAAELEVPTDARMTKVQLCMTCLAWANQHVADPLSALGQIIGDLMEDAIDDDSALDRRKRIRATLLRSRYEYVIGGQIRTIDARPATEVPSAGSGVANSNTREAKRASQSDLLEWRKNRRVTNKEARVTKSASNPMAPKRAQKSKRERSTMFIGSTVEALPLANALHTNLDHDIEVTIWNHGLFEPGRNTWSELVEKAANFDFALFIFSGDDRLTSRKKESLAIRDNVLIEYGLFAGKLGQDRVFFMYNRDRPPKIASDLAGVTPLRYGDRSDENNIAAVSPAADKIRAVATKLGKREQSANP